MAGAAALLAVTMLSGCGGSDSPSAAAPQQVLASATAVNATPVPTAPFVASPPGPAPVFPSAAAEPDKGAIITQLPLPHDSTILPQTNGADLVFASHSAGGDVITGFDSYLNRDGWERVPSPTESGLTAASWNGRGFTLLLAGAPGGDGQTQYSVRLTPAAR
jgi:hypothetical protein